MIRLTYNLCGYAIIIFLTACSEDVNQPPGLQDNGLGSLTWERSAENPVLTGNGASIEDLADPSVIYDNGVFKMWAGCVGDDKTLASVCYSESIDGISWSQPEIVFTPRIGTDTWDNQKVEIPTVIKDDTEPDDNKRYKMWYGGANSITPDNTVIGYAFSPDGKTWTRLAEEESPHGEAGLVMIPGFEVGDAGVVSDPTTIKIDGSYHMWYNSFGANNEIMISYATSSNGYNWDKNASNPVVQPTEIWEDLGPGDISKDVSQPFVGIHPISGEFYLLYGSFNATVYETYDGFGFASSGDGVDWIKDTGNPFFTPSTNLAAEELGIHAACVVVIDQTYHMFYGAVDSAGRRNILHASAEFVPN